MWEIGHSTWEYWPGTSFILLTLCSDVLTFEMHLGYDRCSHACVRYAILSVFSSMPKFKQRSGTARNHPPLHQQHRI